MDRDTWAAKTDAQRAELGYFIGRLLPPVTVEMAFQLNKWGYQHYPNSADDPQLNRRLADYYKQLNSDNSTMGRDNWQDLVFKELYEATAETDVELTRQELIQVVALVLSWIRDLDDNDE